MVDLVPADFIKVFANGFRSQNEVECEIFSEQLNLILSLVLSDYCRMIQTEVMIKKIDAVGNPYYSISYSEISYIYRR